MENVKIVVEKHDDGFVAYPIGLKGIVVGEGETFEEAFEDVKSAIKFHIETFGNDVFVEDKPKEIFISEAIPKNKVLKILKSIGFEIVREGNHISMLKKNQDGGNIPLTLPNHKKIKGSTLRIILNQSGVSREEFIKIFEDI